MPTDSNTTRPRPYPRKAVSLDRSGGANPADAAGANINTIVAQYRRNGTLPAVQLANPLYGDHTGPQDLMAARLAIQEAEDRFRELPAEVRSRAQNDPGVFLNMLDDPTQRASLVSAGLILLDQDNNPITEPPQPPSQPPSVTPEPTPPEEPSIPLQDA